MLSDGSHYANGREEAVAREDARQTPASSLISFLNRGHIAPRNRKAVSDRDHIEIERIRPDPPACQIRYMV
jgi:hypothetical protein